MPRRYLSDPQIARQVRDIQRRRLREQLEAPFRKDAVATQTALFIAVFVLWWLPLPNPLKMITVLIHEASHGIAAYLTGGTVIGVALDPWGAGVTMGVGGNEVVIVAAGYVGSLLFGAGLYLLAARWEPGQVWLCLTLLCVLSTLVGWLNVFSGSFIVGVLIILLLGQIVIPAAGKSLLLRLLATTSCLYPVIDVAGELVRGESGFVVAERRASSDMARLADISGVPEVVLTIIWVGLGVALGMLLIDRAAKIEAAMTVRKSVLNPFRSARHRMAGMRDPIYHPNDPKSVPTYRLR